MAQRAREHVQATMVPPPVVDAVLSIRWDSPARSIHVGCRITDPHTGELLAVGAAPFRGPLTIEIALEHAAELLESQLRAVIDPDPF